MVLNDFPGSQAPVSTLSVDMWCLSLFAVGWFDTESTGGQYNTSRKEEEERQQELRLDVLTFSAPPRGVRWMESPPPTHVCQTFLLFSFFIFIFLFQHVVCMKDQACSRSFRHKLSWTLQVFVSVSELSSCAPPSPSPPTPPPILSHCNMSCIDSLMCSNLTSLCG